MEDFKEPAENMSDTELLRILAQNDRQAGEAVLEEILRRHYSWITRMCIYELRDQDSALDCAQNIMVEVAKSIGRFDGRSELKTWLYVIVKRSISRARKKTLAIRSRQQSLEEIVEPPESLKTLSCAETNLIQSDRQRLLLTLIGELPERQRHALLLHYFEDASVEDAARQMGCAVATLKTHLHRGRRALERRIRGKGKELLVNE